MGDHLVAVDVGTGSARAGVFTASGALLAKAQHPIEMNRPRHNHAEHDSENIWAAVCLSVRKALADSGLAADAIAAIGFDATCSLVVRDAALQPVTVSTGGEDRFDTVVWLDHRALKEADFCTATGHPVLEFSGGYMSPEMEVPKLMWLKQNMPDTWSRAGAFFDLADFLTFKATGSLARSVSTLTAKWNFLAHEPQGWSDDFLTHVGLPDLLERGCLPDQPVAVGSAVGHLTPAAAEALGLSTRCAVAAGMVDAYAGALGLLGGHAAAPATLERQVALIAGTSSCIVHLAQTCQPLGGFWGPYRGAAIGGLWLREGGQSATGALLDHVVAMHAAGGDPVSGLHERIITRIGDLMQAEGIEFGSQIHVLPDFHGNRSPLADPHATGVISGLTLDTSFDGLCRLYWRTCVAIALGIRHILEALASAGTEPEALHVAGGHAKNPLLMQLYADVTGCRVLTPATDPVLLGTAINAASAAGLFAGLAEAGAAMTGAGCLLQPDPSRAAFFDRDYRRFLAMIRHRAELAALE